ncbi:MAG: hypothetical protein MZV63_57280 [Marinilabiliales bacterium]|nr:hypothetical protein [Marinilabiliales bacterium]
MKGRGKATLVFTLPHEQGSLAAILTMLAGKGMQPDDDPVKPCDRQRMGVSVFHPILFSSDYKKYQKAIEEMKQTCNELRVHSGFTVKEEVYSEENAPGGEVNDENKIIELWNR